MAITKVESFRPNPEGGYTFDVVLPSRTGKPIRSDIHVQKVEYNSLAIIKLDRKRSIDRLIKFMIGCFEYNSNFFEEVKKAFNIRADVYIYGVKIYHRGVVIHVSSSSNEQRAFEEWLTKKGLISSTNNSDAIPASPDNA